MKLSGIGGQAVIEGIMMRNQDKYSVAIRKPDNEIEVIVKENTLATKKYKWLNYPIIRGVFNFFDSLVTGLSVLNYSSTFYEDPSEREKTKIDEIGKNIFKDKFESILMAVTVILSIFLAVALFMVVPYLVSRALAVVVSSKGLLNFFEGIIRLIIFVLYLALISQMGDIKRTFMYHGAEHKCINCIENGARLTPENVKNSSRYHKRCGTSFLFIVMFVSIVFFIFIRIDNTVAQLIIRILLMPVIAGVSYEVIRFAGKVDNKFTRLLSKPGMWLQKLTTREPDMDMIEVAIKAVEKVFDWEKFLVEDYYKDSTDIVADIESSERELAIAAVHMGKTTKKTRSISVEAEDKEEKELTAEEKYIQAAKEFETAEKDNSLESVYETIEELENEESTTVDETADFVIESLEESKVEDEGIVFEEPMLETETVSEFDDELDSSAKDAKEEVEGSSEVDGFVIEDLEENAEDADLDFEYIDEESEDDENEEIPAFKSRNRK